MELNTDTQKMIELVLRRRIKPDEHGNVDSFSALSESDMNEIRLCGERNGVLAICYIRYRLKGDVKLSQAMSYYSSVIQQGLAVDEWLKG